ncbi:hypothetical protein DF186_19365, partial [Enterococcus hirae]
PMRGLRRCDRSAVGAETRRLVAQILPQGVEAAPAQVALVRPRTVEQLAAAALEEQVDDAPAAIFLAPVQQIAAPGDGVRAGVEVD